MGESSLASAELVREMDHLVALRDQAKLEAGAGVGGLGKGREEQALRWGKCLLRCPTGARGVRGIGRAVCVGSLGVE